MAVPIFDIDKFVPQYIPPNKRKPKYIAGFQGFLSGLTWCMSKFLAYKNGETLLLWVIGSTYNTGDKVQWNFSTYESLIDSNTGNQPDISIASGQWTLRNKSFIGADERVKADGKYLKLTWELNRQFQTTFRQPPYPAPYDFGVGGGVFPDIYITNQPITLVTFVAAPSSALSSMVAVGTTTWYVPVSPTYGSSSSYGFIVNIPVAVWTALGATSAIRNSIINSFVAQYAVCGTHWSIVTY